MIKNIEKIFSYLPDENKIKITSLKGKDDCKGKTVYPVFIDIKDSSFWGKVEVNYRGNPTTYKTLEIINLEEIDEPFKYELSDEIKKEILSLAREIEGETETTIGYGFKIFKAKNDFILNIPEIEYKKYYASDYFYKEDLEEEEEC